MKLDLLTWRVLKFYFMLQTLTKKLQTATILSKPDKSLTKTKHWVVRNVCIGKKTLIRNVKMHFTWTKCWFLSFIINTDWFQCRQINYWSNPRRNMTQRRQWSFTHTDIHTVTYWGLRYLHREGVWGSREAAQISCTHLLNTTAAHTQTHTQKRGGVYGGEEEEEVEEDERSVEGMKKEKGDCRRWDKKRR